MMMVVTARASTCLFGVNREDRRWWLPSMSPSLNQRWVHFILVKNKQCFTLLLAWSSYLQKLLFFSTLTWMPLYIFTIPLFSIRCSQSKRNKIPVVFFSIFLPDNRFVVVLFQIFFSMQTVLESKSRKQAYPKETYRPKFRGGPNSQLSNGHVPSGVQREDESPHLRQVRTMFVSLRWSMVIIMRGTSRINAHILWLEDVLHYQLQPLK